MVIRGNQLVLLTFAALHFLWCPAATALPISLVLTFAIETMTETKQFSGLHEMVELTECADQKMSNTVAKLNETVAADEHILGCNHSEKFTCFLNPVDVPYAFQRDGFLNTDAGSIFEPMTNVSFSCNEQARNGQAWDSLDQSDLSFKVNTPAELFVNTSIATSLATPGGYFNTRRLPGMWVSMNDVTAHHFGNISVAATQRYLEPSASCCKLPSKHMSLKFKEKHFGQDVHKDDSKLSSRVRSCPAIENSQPVLREKYESAFNACACAYAEHSPDQPAILHSVDETLICPLHTRYFSENKTHFHEELKCLENISDAWNSLTRNPSRETAMQSTTRQYSHKDLSERSTENCQVNEQSHENFVYANGCLSSVHRKGSRRRRKFRRKSSVPSPRKKSAMARLGQTSATCREKKQSSNQLSQVLTVTGAVPLRSSTGQSLSYVSSLPNVRPSDHEQLERSETCISYSNTSIASLESLERRVQETTLVSSPLRRRNSSSSKRRRSRKVSSKIHSNRSFCYNEKGQRCRCSQRRNSRDKYGAMIDDGQFTVVPVSNERTVLQRQVDRRAAKRKGLRIPLSTFDIDGEHSDTLTQTSITSLLSAKFRDVAKRWKQYGVDSPRFRKRLHSKWESMNYEEVDSQLQRQQNEEKKSKKKLALEMLSSWLIFFAIGLGTAFLAAGVQISVELVAGQKFGLIRDFMDKCDKEGCLVHPILIWMTINLSITLLGAALVTYVQPMAAGSGIPLIKSYLNGIRVPGLLSLHAFIAKCVGVVLSILGGLACGKEGPMAHSGAIVAAGFGKGRIPWFKKDISLFSLFRTDHNIRDLVAAGAASGVSAAFGAPIGGTLFSLEEAASFWNTELVWKVFFSAMIACFSTNVLLSAFEGHPTQLSNPGLVRFNTFPNLTFDLIEIPVFIIMAALGGLIGSLFVVMNYKLTVFRQKYLHRRKWIKVAEAGLVAVVSAIAAFVLMFAVNDCTHAQPYSNHAITTKMGCRGDYHNSMSTLFLTTPEGCLKSLLHDPLDDGDLNDSNIEAEDWAASDHTVYNTYSVLTLVLFIVVFFLLGVWTYGLSVSSGVFIPSLAIGAAWGRLIGLGVVQLFPDQAKDVGKYALIGAASQLGGILRTTISLTVIIVECTGDITFGLCIMISLMISKWVGDLFTTGLYDMNVEVSGIPLLSWEPPPLCEHIYVSDFMSQPVMTLLPVEKVGHIYDCLSGETFHGFPVIEQDENFDILYKGKLKGIILRHQLLVLLKKRVFCAEGEVPTNTVTLEDFENPYLNISIQKIQNIELSEEDKECVMDLTPYMDQTPYTVSLNFSMPRVFRLFRGLGLRHLVVVNDNCEPIGMVTRKDLAKYRAEIKKGMLHMEHLTVENR